MNRISILIVDDHPVVREGLAAMLSVVDRFTVVGEAATGIEAVREAARTHPDVAIIDLELPPTDGIATIRDVRACSPQTRVLVFTAFRNDERVMGALKAGAHGYVLKGTPRHQLFEAIETVHRNKTSYQSEVAQVVFRQASMRGRSLLTDRQQAIVRLLAEGMSNREMATALQIRERTVKYHLAALFDRLGVNNRTEALVVAMKMGLIGRS